MGYLKVVGLYEKGGDLSKPAFARLRASAGRLGESILAPSLRQMRFGRQAEVFLLAPIPWIRLHSEVFFVVFFGFGVHFASAGRAGGGVVVNESADKIGEFLVKTRK